ncbi:hypothetical protein CEV31_0241 [Brucella thiophenivorans]|uniref:Uncharacterized protein n=1 Tax=Brucella thiophenivorans TaxID=571255 RepID=A0A256G5E2_9HYPH|nr:hypothetical protein CEV31_0241 [Brucella thiophenivorans]
MGRLVDAARAIPPERIAMRITKAAKTQYRTIVMKMGE